MLCALYIRFANPDPVQVCTSRSKISLKSNFFCIDHLRYIQPFSIHIFPDNFPIFQQMLMLTFKKAKAVFSKTEYKVSSTYLYAHEEILILL